MMHINGETCQIVMTPRKEDVSFPSFIIKSINVSQRKYFSFALREQFLRFQVSLSCTDDVP